ncbi:MAG: F0F1 ATP synthase subunit delta [Acidobacteria bacterium]|nr:F0F1 ATP synthase subunit delta [Acidobacteriota bacterium]
MSVGKVAQRYAKALVDLVLEKDQQAVVQEELSAYNELMHQTPEMQAVFANPAISKSQKERILQWLLQRTKPSPLVENFLRLLLKNKRLHNLGEMYAAYLQELDHRLGITTAEVITARPLRDDEHRRLRSQLEKLTGKQVRMQVEANPEILGGVVARIGSEVYDGSIQSQLENIRRQLSQ